MINKEENPENTQIICANAEIAASTRNAVETAIRREKQEKSTSWESNQFLSKKEIPKWKDKRN